MNTVRTRSFALVAGLSVLAASGCDSPKESSGEVKSAAAADKQDDAEPAKKAEPKPEPAKAEPEPEPEPKVVACDQRDFIPEGDKKMAAALGKEPKPKLVCMDYSGRTGGIGKPSCVQGTALETPCPDEEVVATCTMSNGTVFKHYKGTTVSLDEKKCKTLEGTFAKK